jgi:fermentation-respiration switch protein FrsA (DUF1100 family)
MSKQPVEDEQFEKCWSEEADQDPNDPNRIRSHRHGAAEIARAVVSFGIYGAFNRVFYHPNSNVYATPDETTNGCEEVEFPSGDGTLLHGWFLPAAGGRALATVVHYHGCCNNLTHDLPFFDWLTDEGFNVLAFDYRGYGRSQGKPSRKGVFLDSLAALDFVRRRQDVDPGRLLVFGQSLGGAIALAAVGEGDRAGILGIAVEGTFHSYRAVVNSKMSNTRITYPLASLIVTDPHAPKATVGSLPPIPLLIFHGDADKVIAVEHGRALRELAGDPKRYVEVPGGEHLDTFLAHDGVHRRELAAFFKRCVGP